MVRYMRITDGVVDSRKTYYLRCSVCGKEIEDWSIDGVKVTANAEGWKYDFQEDRVLCSECYEKEVLE